jgi:DNA polymerase (family X)
LDVPITHKDPEMTNYEIADQFSLLSKLMDIHGENSFKSKSYSIAAYNIERLPAEAATMDEAALFSMKGIGESTGKKILELLHTGRLKVLDEIIAATPPGILDMLRIKGLGPKKIAVIWTELGIESLGELEYACNENRLVALKGFGAKTQESVLQNIVYFKQNIGFHLWAEAEPFAESRVQQLRQNNSGHRFETSGEFRRQNDTVEFVDVVTDMPLAELADQFGNIPDVLPEYISDDCLKVALPGQPRLLLHAASETNFFKRIFETSCSEQFLNAFRSSYTIPDTPQSEEEIFTANGLPVVPVMMREDAAILDSKDTSAFENLIQPGQIRGIIHSHSTWSDGVHTIAQMAEAAMAAGLEYMVISDHSQTAFYAGGLKPEQVAAQHQEIDALNARLAPFRIFKSIESDILGDGRLDYSDQVLATFDLVIASVHSNLKMTEEKAMERLLNAIANPYTTILGHPTGRLLLSRKGYPVDHKAMIDACVEHGVVIEINAHPRRLDLDWRWVTYALEKGAILSIDPDAHSIDGFHDTYFGVKVAQKGGLTAASNLSSFSLAQLEAFIAQSRIRRGTNK